MRRLREQARSGYRSAVEGLLGGRIFWRVPEGVALTFDDGPDPEHTPRLLDHLAAAGACATFFVLGEQVERHPELVRRMAREGHAIGNHTFSHPHCRGLDLTALRRELELTDAAITAALGVDAPSGLPIFRPPFGELRAAPGVRLAAEGRRIAFWSRDSRDYRDASVAEIARLGSIVQSGDVILMHDRFPATVEALPELLRQLARRRLATVALGAPEGGAAPAPAAFS